MIKKAFIFLMLLGVYTAQAQNEAEQLLDKVYQTLSAYENIRIDFSYNLYNEEADIRQETTGNVVLAGEKYRFNYMGILQFFDGKRVVTIVPENEEVTIENKMEDDEAFNPANLVNFYREGYTYEIDILQNVKGKNIQYVKLTPINSDSEVTYILLGIDTENYHIYRMIQSGENGTKTTITVNTMETNKELDPQLFIFDESHYESLGYYIIKN